MNITNFKNVLVLAPHTDDGELGCGGTISKLIEDGVCVTYVAFSIAEESVPPNFPCDILSKEVKEATRILGILPQNLIILNYKVRKFNYVRQEILEDLVKLRNTNTYDLVFIPSLNDLHQDHSTIAEEGLRAFKHASILKRNILFHII